MLLVNSSAQADLAWPKWVKFGHANKLYLPKTESTRENERHKIIRDFEIKKKQTKNKKKKAIKFQLCQRDSAFRERAVEIKSLAIFKKTRGNVKQFFFFFVKRM